MINLARLVTIPLGQLYRPDLIWHRNKTSTKHEESGKPDSAPLTETLGSTKVPKKLTSIPPPSDRVTQLPTATNSVGPKRDVTDCYTLHGYTIHVDPNNSEVPAPIWHHKAIANLSKAGGPWLGGTGSDVSAIMKRRAEEDEQHHHEDIEIAAASLKLAPMAQRAPRVAHTSSSSHHLKKEKMHFKYFLINPDEPNVAGEQEMKQVMSDDSSRVDLSLTGVNINIKNATSNINSSNDEIFSETMDNHSRLSPPDLDMHSSAYNSDRIDLVDDHGNSANNSTSLGKDASPESEGGYGLELIGHPLPKHASEFDSDNTDTEHLTVKKPCLRTLELPKSSKVHLSLPPTAQTQLHSLTPFLLEKDPRKASSCTHWDESIELRLITVSISNPCKY
ncbi:hypothetical protein BS47DRAFT_1367646 [Hydnum rufescens UP504]|uniref:Uncharacterized protein n=1 Tax=Hydnum rufescens UP504 TaxID=1448309 RepID=A0A9P6AI89_9AGAM|nr:hypothetical protein BS47DRAFT_1367646 [Hydnum rufescens UP504]